MERPKIMANSCFAINWYIYTVFSVRVMTHTGMCTLCNIVCVCYLTGPPTEKRVPAEGGTTDAEDDG